MTTLNVLNRTLFHSDNLPVLRGINTDSIDLVANDPPFQKGRDFHATPDTLAAGAGFQDRWKWTDEPDTELLKPANLPVVRIQNLPGYVPGEGRWIGTRYIEKTLAEVCHISQTFSP